MSNVSTGVGKYTIAKSINWRHLSGDNLPNYIKNVKI